MAKQKHVLDIDWLWRSLAGWQAWIVLALLLLAILMLLLMLVWVGAIETGFGEYQPPEPGRQRAKTLWDWMDLLLVPLVLATGAALIVAVTDRRERSTARRCDQRERELALDRSRQITLQAYFDHMAELLRDQELLAKDLLARNIARARTLAALHQLDPDRKGMLLQFAYEAGLIKKEDCIMSLNGADLSRANLRKVNLRSANLGQVNLREANLERTGLTDIDLHQADLVRANLHFAELSGANLNGANATGACLSGTNLRDANLSWSNLSGTNLIGSDLSGAILVGAMLVRANLTGVSLRWANLREADLQGALVTDEQLDEVASLEGATLPDGTVVD